MFKRKIEKYLKEWKSDEHKMPLIIKGCRQCGKTFSVLDFAHKNYEHVVYIDFFQHPEYKSVFDGGLNIDLLCMTLSTLIPDANFVSGKTCIIQGGRIKMRSPPKVLTGNFRPSQLSFFLS